MTKLKNAALGLISVAALSVPSISMAQSTMSTVMNKGSDAGWFVGGSVGQSKSDCGTSIAGSSCDDSDTALRIFGGYQWNRHIGLEVGYATLGEVKASVGALSATAEAKAFDLMAVGTLPVAEKFNVFGKLGWFKADTDVSSNFGVSGSDSSSGLTYAVGAGYDFNKNFGLRLEWQRYTDVGGNNSGGETDVDVMSIGVVYRFR
jgi:OmpA-OmpF porin, OOP family